MRHSPRLRPSRSERTARRPPSLASRLFRLSALSVLFGSSDRSLQREPQDGPRNDRTALDHPQADPRRLGGVPDRRSAARAVQRSVVPGTRAALPARIAPDARSRARRSPGPGRPRRPRRGGASRSGRRGTRPPATTRSRADAGTRTPDPFITSEVLYQLSYVGVSQDPSPSRPAPAPRRRRAGAAGSRAAADPEGISGRSAAERHRRHPGRDPDAGRTAGEDGILAGTRTPAGPRVKTAGDPGPGRQPARRARCASRSTES